MTGHDHERWQELAGRETLGEALTPEERAFQRAHEAVDPVAAAESAAFGDLLDHLRRRAETPLAEAEADARLERALAEIQPEVQAAELRPAPIELRPRSRGRALVGAGLGLAAAAALVGLWVASRTPPSPVIAVAPPPPAPERASPTPPSRAPERAPAPSASENVLVAMSAGSGLSGADGVPLGVGSILAEGATIDARGEGCIVLRDPLAAICLDVGARLHIESAHGGERRLALERGRLIAALDPLPAGASFAVVTPAGSAHAVGTVFAVSVADDGARVGVLEGKVDLRRTGAPTRRLVADEHAALDGSPLTPVPEDLAAWAGPRSALIDLWRAADLATLALSPASGEGPPLLPALALDGHPLAPATAAILVPPGSHRLVAARSGRADAVAQVDAPGGGRVELAVPAAPRGKASAPPIDPPEPADPIADLRRAAGEARAAGRWADAVVAYQSLIGRFPDSPEAHNARVQLGDLLRVRRGDPAGALVHYQAYIDRGGPLDAEARHGAILCLQRLGRRQEERAAIAEFLARHPRHLEADALRRRGEDLGGP